MPTTDARLGNFLADDDEERQQTFADPYNGGSQLITEEFARRQKEIRQQRADAERLSNIPYGTPTTAGGTATRFGVQTENMGTMKDPASQTTIQVIDPGASRVSTGTGDPLSQLGDIEDDAARRSDAGNAERNNALQNIIDRYDAVTLDTTQSDSSRRAQDEAIRMNRQLFDKANSYDRDAAAQKFSENALASSLAVARSAPGGAGREEALFNALSSMPGVQAEGQRQANEEGRAQELQALRAAGQLGQQATQTRGLDQQQAETKSSIGLDVAQGISNAVGHDLDLDARDREFLGELALSVARLNLDWEQLDVSQQEAELDRALQREGLEQEWRQFKQSQKVTGKDILGGIFSLGGGVISGLATGKAAGR